MSKKNIIISLLFISISNFCYAFIDPSINQILTYIDKDSAGNYAFIKGLSDQATKKTDSFLSLGVVGSGITPRLGDKSDYLTAVPLINGRYKDFYTFGGLYNGYNFYEGEKLSLNITAEYRFTGHKEHEFDSYLKEVPDRSNPIMVGFGGRYQLGYTYLIGSINHDTRGDRQSNAASIGIIGGIPFRKFILLAYLNYELMSNSFVNRYFGIPDGSYNSPKVQPYNIGGIGQALRFSTVLAYSASENIDVFTYFYSETLSKNVRRSSLMSGHTSNMIGIGATYTF